MNRTELSRYLSSKSLPHVRPEMVDPRLTFSLDWRPEPIFVDKAVVMQFGPDKPEERDLPNDIESAIIGSSGVTDDGQILFLRVDIDGPNYQSQLRISQFCRVAGVVAIL